MSFAIPKAGDTANVDTNASGNSIAQRDANGGLTVNQLTASEVKSTGIVTRANAAKSASFTADGTASDYFCDATSAAIVATLPLASTCAGRLYLFKKIDSAAHNVTVTAAGSDTIDGAATSVLSSQYQKVAIESNGSVWWIVG